MKLFSAFAHYPRDEDTGTGKFKEAIYGASLSATCAEHKCPPLP
jgi:hypothetical protein